MECELLNTYVIFAYFITGTILGYYIKEVIYEHQVPILAESPSDSSSDIDLDFEDTELSSSEEEYSEESEPDTSSEGCCFNEDCKKEVTDAELIGIVTESLAGKPPIDIIAVWNKIVCKSKEFHEKHHTKVKNELNSVVELENKKML